MSDALIPQVPTAMPTELRARGYAVLPAPRRVELRDEVVRLDEDWGLDPTDLDDDDAAVRALNGALLAEHDLDLPPRSAEGQMVRLAVRPGAVQTGTDDDRDAQAYRLTVTADAVEVTGNAHAGLFYGVQTLLQLLDGDGRGTLRLPVGTIVDWPEYALRFVHWDTKHHQDRLETLRRFLDWMARFKLNAVSFELEDKFEYPSHPVIGAPGALTAAQLQGLADYALQRHIQIVPNVQAPAHLCYVLKHQEFAHLRCDGSNYQICMDEPEARRLLFDMYDDLCDATKGVEYFHVSTDEVYYAGICEKHRRPYNPQNRSLTWVDYVRAAHEHLAARGRRVLIWAEFPLLAEHVAMLPGDVINGILGPRVREGFVRALEERGIDCLVYAPMQGEERLFPNHFTFTDRHGRLQPGHLADAYEATLRPNRHSRRHPVGTFAAAWDDAALHNETFWLGWAVMAQGGWSPGAADVEQTAADFMDIYYGREAVGMTQVYRQMQDQARFWERTWDRVPSKVRPPAYGYSAEKRPVTRRDLTLPAPALPAMPDLAVEPVYEGRYAEMLAEACERLRQSDSLLAGLYANVLRARRNRYNLEVFLSLAMLIRHHIETLLAVGQAERRVAAAHEAHRGEDPQRALDLLLEAHGRIDAALARKDGVLANLTRVWEKGRRPRNAPVGGRRFVHVMDDVKDHFADRRADLTYHTAPLESIGLDKWRDALGELIGAYAGAHGLPPPGAGRP
jgi:hypothetical protein